MNLLSYWNKRSFYGWSIVWFLAIFLLLAIMYPQSVPPTTIVFVELALIAMLFICANLYSTKSLGITLLVIFFYQMCTSYGLRFFNVEYFDNMLGYKPVDAKFYHYVGSHFYLSFTEFMRYMTSHKYDIDDMGFMLIVFYTYKLAGTGPMGCQLLVAINAFAVTASSYFLYKLCRLFLDNKQSLFICFMWGVQFYACYTASVGLKENFMVMPIIACFYYLARLNKVFNTYNLLMSFMCALFMLLFRMPLFYMYLASLSFVVSLRFPYVRKYIVIFIIGIIAAAYVYSYKTIDTIAMMRGYNYDFLVHLTDRKVNNAGYYAQIVNMLSSLIGPVPSIIADKVKQNYITLFSFTSFINMIISFYFLYGVVMAIKNKTVEYFPIIIFWLLNTFMLVFTFFSLHDRYQWPHVAFTMMIAGYGYNMWRSNKHIAKWDRYYMVLSILVVLVFNGRF